MPLVRSAPKPPKIAPTMVSTTIATTNQTSAARMNSPPDCVNFFQPYEKASPIGDAWTGGP